MNIYAELNRQYSLNDMVCIADIASEEQLQTLAQNGYYAGFTAESWAKNYPSIDAKNIFCLKTILFPMDLLYLDMEHYICFHTRIYDGKFLSYNGKDSFESDARKNIQGLMKAYEEKDYYALLSASTSEQSGNIAMAILNKMLEQEKGSAKLYKAFLSHYTFCDCGAQQISRANMEKVRSCKTKRQTEATLKRLSSYPDEITIYRGEGSQSTDYAQAYSWTTDLNTAYFFAAWKGGESARLISAVVNKADVIEYIEDRNESEIIVFSDRLKNVSVKRFIQFDWFKEVITSGFSGYKKELSLNSFSAENLKNDIGEIYEDFAAGIEDHDEKHSCRVAFFASFIYRIDVLFEKSKTKKDKLKTLRYFGKLMDAAKWHDVGRCDSSANEHHGIESSKIYESENGRDDIVQFLIKNHCVDDDVAKQEWESLFAENPDRDIIWNLFCILKDADALDRCRFGNATPDSLDIRYLRLETSKQLVPVAVTLQRYRF